MSVKHQLTAMIFDKRGMVLSVGQNSYLKTHPKQAKWANRVGRADAIYLHAEIAAIIRCPDISRAYRILVTRYNKDGQPVMAAPCSICASAIAATSIKVIQHT